jgi:hypothetical protein
VLGDDGLYRQDWFLQSFLELGPDLEDAAAEGKRLAVMIEQRGCPYCRDTHLINLADPRSPTTSASASPSCSSTSSAISTSPTSTARCCRKRQIRRALRGALHADHPVLSGRGRGAGRPAAARARGGALVGYQEPDAFRRSFAFVHETAYETESLADYLARTA